MTEAEFTKAYDLYADAIFRYFYFRVYDREKAKDLTQDTFMKTWTYLARGEVVQSMRAFLYRVARNLVIDHSRKKKMESLDKLTEEGFQPGIDHRDSLHHALDADAAVEKLQQLDSKYKDAVLMRYVDGLSPKEIAKALHENENVISVRIHRGLKQLRELLEPNE